MLKMACVAAIAVAISYAVSMVPLLMLSPVMLAPGGTGWLLLFSIPYFVLLNFWIGFVVLFFLVLAAQMQNLPISISFALFPVSGLLNVLVADTLMYHWPSKIHEGAGAFYIGPDETRFGVSIVLVPFSFMAAYIFCRVRRRAR
ncbi:hypothetical protein [Devosia enhydra]|uniref:hypothetical protein n=1 Tax=Devosia enhydra TaxID=665118 RepID=UPI001160D1C8|nr:hypothetical protein [Devosia enhydra]